MLPICRQVCPRVVHSSCAAQSPWGVVKMQILMQKVRDGLRFLRFNELPGGADAAGR